MKDPRPLSERFDLTYVRRNHLADRWIWKLSGIAVLAGLAWITTAAALRDETPYNSGPLTHAHAMFADDCSKCHVGSNGWSEFSVFSRPVDDGKCRDCHVAPAHSPHQSRFTGEMMSISGHRFMTAARCSACHIEHQGADHNLAAAPDLTCTQCHADLTLSGRLPEGVMPSNSDATQGEAP